MEIGGREVVVFRSLSYNSYHLGQKELNCKQGIIHERKVDIKVKKGAPIRLATKKNCNTAMT